MIADLPKRPLAFEALALGFLLLVAIWTWGEPPTRRVPDIPRIVAEWREVLDKRIGSVFINPVTPWVSGILLGDDSGFSRQWKDAFRTTGTSHLTAVSGYNVSVVFGLVENAARRLTISRRKRLILGMLAVALFVLLTGMPASVLRAAVMALAVMLAREAGRPIKPLRALLLAVIVLVALKPTLLLYDLGFQLSVLATFGLTSMTEPLRVTAFRRLPSLLGEGLAQTMAATVTVAPVIAYRFGTFSSVALLANVAVILFIPLLMSLSAVLLVLAFVFLPFAQLLARMTHILFMAPLHVIRFFSHAPHASVMGKGAVISVILSVGLVAALLFWWWKRKRKAFFL